MPKHGVSRFLLCTKLSNCCFIASSFKHFLMASKAKYSCVKKSTIIVLGVPWFCTTTKLLNISKSLLAILRNSAFVIEIGHSSMMNLTPHILHTTKKKCHPKKRKNIEWSHDSEIQISEWKQICRNSNFRAKAKWTFNVRIKFYIIQCVDIHR